MATRGKQSYAERDLIYFAGIVDADGCISIARSKPSSFKSNQRVVNPRYVLELTVTNISLDLMMWLVGKFGGSYTTRRTLPENRRTTYDWKYANGKAAPLIAAIRPFLLIKARQADLGIALIDGWVTKPGRGGQTPAYEVQRREALYQQVRELNRRGVQPQRLNLLAPAEAG